MNFGVHNITNTAASMLNKISPPKRQALWMKAFPKQAGKLSKQSRLKRDKTQAFRRSSAFQRRKRIKPVSLSKRQQLKEYAAEKARWRQSDVANLRCIITNEPHPDTHHTRGKLGELLCLSVLWLPVSRRVHNWVAGNPELARMAGLLCPEGKWNTMPTPAEIAEHNYRVAWLRLLIGGHDCMKPVRPMLATKICEAVESDMQQVIVSQFWKLF